MRELRRREVPRTVAAYVVAALAVWGGLELASDAFGWSGRVLGFAIVASVVGLPVVVLAAWFLDLRLDDGITVDVGASDDAVGRKRGPGTSLVVAAGVVALALAGYWAVGAMGRIGPRSLMAQGLLTEGDPIVLAHFASDEDGPLGDLVTETIRVSLATSPAFRLLDAAQVRGALERMTRDPGTRIDEATAVEVAVREGATAVIAGSARRAGRDIVLLADVLSLDGATLVSFRVTSDGDDELVDAIDRLASEIRRNIGESLRSVRRAEPLRQVTTASLPALRSYTAGVRAYAEGDAVQAVALLRDAVAQDPGFAMAYRQLGIALISSRGTEEERDRVGARAFELRDRLTQRERYMAEAYYYDRVAEDVSAEMRAYEQVLALAPGDANTLNMKGRALAQHHGDFVAAARAMEDAVAADPGFFPPYSNLVWTRLFLGDVDGARAIQVAFEDRFPDTFWKHRGAFLVGYHTGDVQSAHEAADSLSRHPAAPDRWRSRAVLYMALADLLGGRVEEARRRLWTDVARARADGALDRGLDRLADLLWIEGAVVGDAVRARAVIDTVLSEGWWGRADPAAVPYFPLVRDAARAGLPEAAETVMAGWDGAIGPGRDRPPGSAEDREVARALIDGARGSGGAVERLRRVQDSPEPRFVPEEWPSARHCQRCWDFDLARLLDRGGETDAAIRAYRAVIDGTADLVETPVQRLLALERLGVLLESAGAVEEARQAHLAFAEGWSGADGPLGERARAASARAAALERSGS